VHAVASQKLKCSENALRDKLTQSVMTQENGIIEIKDAPGLGVEVNEDYLKELLQQN